MEHVIRIIVGVENNWHYDIGIAWHTFISFANNFICTRALPTEG